MPLSYLKKYWKYPSFRPYQEEIIQSVLSENDTLVLLPTGGGKSICYQIPALMLPGFCLVVSPLIALMHDQVNRLKSLDISAVYFHSAQSRKELELEMENLRNNKYKLAYVSPERLHSELFKTHLPNLKVSFVAVDEAHCISQWGHDFRPSYLQIQSIREHKPNITILALTASATPKVSADICEHLELKSPTLIRDSFQRPNLNYRIRYSENKRDILLRTCRQTTGSIIIYAGTRAKVVELSRWLQQEGIKCEAYHAGFTSDQRKTKLDGWLTNKFPVMVCTNAFGMGIDKPDVRFVVHHIPPNGLEAYYQEAGRAGRDGKEAICLLLYDEGDLTRDRLNLATQHQSLKQIRLLYESVCNYFQLAIFSGKGSSFRFNLEDFCSKFNLRPIEVHYGLKQLEALNYILLTDSDILSSKVRIELDATSLYDFQLRHEHFEPLIKVLLRTYGGIHEHFTHISERQLAQKLHLTGIQVQKQLNELNDLKTLSYLPHSDKALITFPIERVKEIQDTEKRLKRLSNEASNRLGAMHSYIQSEMCRVKSVCGYFGEKVKENCEKCDVCLAKKRNAFSVLKFKRISNDLELLLKNKHSSLSEILQSLKGDEDEIKMVVRWLIEDGEAGIDERRRIYWKK